MNSQLSPELLKTKAQLLGSLLLFTQTFYKLRTGRSFVISQPVSAESHFITICRALTKVFYLETDRLLINCPPGWGKSELCKHFLAWAYAHYPDCASMYISYSHELAAEHTFGVKEIMQLSYYRKLFDVEIPHDSSAKDNFKTVAGGKIVAFGSSGSITGRDMGFPGVNRFSGCGIMDDMHKPDQVHSDTVREGVIQTYNQTIKIRPRAINVPLIFIGQRLHQEDLPAYLLAGKDGYRWETVILKGIDDAGNAGYPEKDPLSRLLIEKDINKYTFYAQYQQDPQPLGGGLFEEDRFVLMDKHPEILATFLTVDTAETDKDYNDATVFSFWGIHWIKHAGVETKQLGLHWIDCLEIRVNPDQLEREFLDFYADCMRFPIPPQVVGIEKKSTGVTLAAVLNRMQGLYILNIERTILSKNKTQRYLSIQPYINGRYVSVLSTGRLWGIDPKDPSKLVNKAIRHCGKITNNGSHAHDDIADTLYDAVKIALIDKTILNFINRHQNPQHAKVAAQLMSKFKQLNHLKSQPNVSHY